MYSQNQKFFGDHKIGALKSYIFAMGRELVVSIDRNGVVVLKIHAMGGYADFALTHEQGRAFSQTLKSHFDALPDPARLYARRLPEDQLSGAKRPARDRVRVRLRCPKCSVENLHVAFERESDEVLVTCVGCRAILCRPVELEASVRDALAQSSPTTPLILEIEAPGNDR